MNLACRCFLKFSEGRGGREVAVMMWTSCHDERLNCLDANSLTMRRADVHPAAPEVGAVLLRDHVGVELISDCRSPKAKC